MSLAENQDGIRLNKYIASSGICTRREAAAKVKAGKVQVNGETILFPGHLIYSSDKVILNGKEIIPLRKFSYILLNKPKRTVCTIEELPGKKTLSKILGNKVEAKVEPVDNLDMDDTGLLLLTDDPDLLKKHKALNHRSKMILHLTLEKEITEPELSKLTNHINSECEEIEFGFMRHIKAKGKNEIDVEVETNSISSVKDCLKKQSIKVLKIDRIYYESLTKKDLPRDRFRHLADKEIILLKHFT